MRLVGIAGLVGGVHQRRPITGQRQRPAQSQHPRQPLGPVADGGGDAPAQRPLGDPERVRQRADPLVGRRPSPRRWRRPAGPGRTRAAPARSARRAAPRPDRRTRTAAPATGGPRHRAARSAVGAGRAPARPRSPAAPAPRRARSRAPIDRLARLHVGDERDRVGADQPHAAISVRRRRRCSRRAGSGSPSPRSAVRSQTQSSQAASTVGRRCSRMAIVTLSLLGARGTVHRRLGLGLLPRPSGSAGRRLLIGEPPLGLVGQRLQRARDVADVGDQALAAAADAVGLGLELAAACAWPRR